MGRDRCPSSCLTRVAILNLSSGDLTWNSLVLMRRNDTGSIELENIMRWGRSILGTILSSVLVSYFQPNHPDFPRLQTEVHMSDRKKEPTPSEEKTEQKAERLQDEKQQEEPIGYRNWRTPTMGGKQFWTDAQHLAGWRIQHNIVTGHYRLIDPDHYRHAWGNRAHCEQSLRQIAESRNLPAYEGRVVILLHGLMRSSTAMNHFVEAIQESGEFQVINFEYASSRDSIEQHAQHVHSVIQLLGNHVEEINFVGHSLGNLVVRRYLHDHSEAGSGSRGYPRINRMVMLAPPNQGSRVAEVLNYTLAFNAVTGKSGKSLSQGWRDISPTLAIPDFDFAILAGSGSDKVRWLQNPLLRGAGDLTVAVEETYLAGAQDHQVLPVYHSSILFTPAVIEATVRYLKNGYLLSEEQRNPIPR